VEVDSQNVEKLVGLQICLSKVVTAIDQLSAGLVTMNEICNINKSASSSSVVDFFKLMEVYGAQSDLPDLDSLQSATFLIQARNLALNKITTVSWVLRSVLDDLKDVQLAAGCLPSLKALSATIDHIEAYWLLKGSSKGDVLFTMAEPTLDQVGHLIRLTGGHNGRISEIEMGLFNMHLERAGFNGNISF